MINKAHELGGDAIAGIDLDYRVIRHGMLMVIFAGIALKLGETINNYHKAVFTNWTCR
jgi:uncharacterized protein YbjQ (UPF0145 family)